RDELIARQRAENPTWSEAELGPWADSKLRLSLNVLNRSSPADMDWAGLLRRITCPALLITAHPERGAIVTPEASAALGELVPQVQVVRIADAGHSIRRDQFAPYMDAVRAFLDAHARGR